MKCLFVILLICLCSATSDVCSVSGDTESKVDYVAMLNELAKKGRDESLNAAPFYVKAAELYVELPEEIENEDLREWPSELTSKKQSLLRQWAKSNINAFAQLKLGTQKPYYWNQYQVDNVWNVFPSSYLPEVRDVVRATLFRVKLSAIEVGMTREIRDDILTCCHFGSHLAQTPDQTEQLLGMGLMGASVQTVFLCLVKIDFDRAAMDLLQSSIHEQLSKSQNQTFSLELEKLRHLETVQMLFQGTEEDSKLKLNEELALAARLGDLTYEDLEALRRGRTVHDIETAFAYCKEFLTMSPWQAREKGLNFWEDLQKQTGGNPVVRICMSNIPRIARVRAHYGANRDALLTTLALLRYRHDRGSLPKDLQELLSADYLSQLPDDPYRDEPLVYRQTGNNFMLYSFGGDFDDDGGTHSNWGRSERGGDYVFWPVQTKSTERED